MNVSFNITSKTIPINFLSNRSIISNTILFQTSFIPCFSFHSQLHLRAKRNVICHRDEESRYNESRNWHGSREPRYRHRPLYEPELSLNCLESRCQRGERWR